MDIVHASKQDIDLIISLLERARGIMRDSGNTQQWADGYPTRDIIAHDIEQHNGYLAIQGGRTVAYFAMIAGPDPTYKQIYDGDWHRHTDDYYVIHRIAGTPEAHGVFGAVVDFCLQHTDYIRIDTHRDNTIMQHLLCKHGFTYCGVIYIANGDDRLAYDMTTDK